MSENSVCIHHAGITAPAEVLEKLVTFYGNILGLTPGFRPEFGGLHGYWLYSGNNPIIHLLEDQNRSAERSGHFDHIALRCEDLEGVITRLNDHEVPFGQIETAEVNQVQLFLTDPAGVSIELNFESAAS